MSYVNNSLLPGEVVIMKGKMHWFLLVQAAFLLFAAYLAIDHINPQTLEKLMNAVIELKKLFGMTQNSSQNNTDQTVVTWIIAVLLVLFSLSKLILYFCTEIAVTNKRFILKRGLISRDTCELNLNRVTGLNVDQTVIGRIFNYGDITIESMGSFLGSPVQFIHDPLTFRKVLMTQVEETSHTQI